MPAGERNRPADWRAAAVNYWSSAEQARKSRGRVLEARRDNEDLWLYGRASPNSVVSRQIPRELSREEAGRAFEKFIDGLLSTTDLFDEPPVRPTDQAAIDVIVCSTFRRREQLDRCIRSILKNAYESYSVIVVKSGPGTQELATDLLGNPRVRYIEEPTIGLSRARNRGLAAANAAYVAFTDDDVVVEPDWISEVMCWLIRPEISSVTGLVIPGEIRTPAQAAFERQWAAYTTGYWSRTLRCTQPSAIIRTVRESSTEDVRGSRDLPLYVAAGNFGVGANMAFKRAVLVDDAFDTCLGAGTKASGGEEIRLFAELLAAGQQLAYVPTAVVRHFHRESYPELRRQIVGLGRSVSAMLIALALDDPRYLIEWTAAKLDGIRRGSRQRLSQPYRRDSRLVRDYWIGLVEGAPIYLTSLLLAMSRGRRRESRVIPDLPEAHI